MSKRPKPSGARGGGGCFANHDIHVFRDPYISSTGESLTAAIVHTASLCIKQCPLKEQVIRYVGIAARKIYLHINITRVSSALKKSFFFLFSCYIVYNAYIEE